MGISVFAPGIFWSFGHRSNQHFAYRKDLGQLKRLLSRAEKKRVPCDLSRVLSKSLGCGDSLFPYAFYQSIASQVAGASGSYAYWTHATPVSFLIEQTTIRLLGQPLWDLSLAEESQLIEALNDLLINDKMKIYHASPGRWLLNSPTPLGLKNAHFYDAILTDLSSVALLESDSQWRNLSTELQMMLHQHNVSYQRRLSGKIDFNGLWYWGEGEKNAINSYPWDAIVTDEPALIGFAKAHHIEHCSIESFSKYDETQLDKNIFIYDESLLNALAHGHFERWIEALELFESQVLHVLEHHKKSIDSLNFYLGNGYQYHVTPKSRWKFWRKVPPTTAYLNNENIK